MKNLTQRTYTLLTQIPKGQITTYKDIGDALGTRAYRAIGQILRVNPYAPTVPCHRVIASNGTIGGFMGHTTGKAIKKKIALLEKEGVRVKNNKIVDFTRIRFRW